MEQADSIKYPFESAPRGDTVEEYPTAGGNYAAMVPDPYRFLEDPDSDATKAWVTEQNKVTDKVLAQCDLRAKLKEKITECWNYAKTGCLKKEGDHCYYQHNTGLQNQFVHLKIKEKNSCSVNAENPLEGTEVLLDPNALSEDGTTSVGLTKWSSNGKYMAYQVKKGGSDWTTIQVRDADTCQDLENDVISWVKFSGMSWTADNKGFFYAAFDPPKSINTDTMDKAGTETDKLKNQKIFYHRLGTKQSDDALIYKNESEPDWVFGASEVTNDGKYLIIKTRKSTERINLIAYVDLEADANKELNGIVTPTVLVNEWIAEFNYLQNHGTEFFFKTNLDAPKSKVIKIDFANPDRSNWADVIEENPKSVLDAAQCCNDKIVAAFVENASEKMRVFDFNTPSNLLKEIEFPDIGTIVGWSGKSDSNELFYKFSSFSDPGSIYRVNLDTFENEMIYTTKLSATSPDVKNFVTDQVWYKSKDGTEVPMFMVRKKSNLPTPESKPEKPIPTLLYGYGGFSISITPYFSPARLVFLHHLNGMFCVANIRGGGEFGEEWHKAGTKAKKQNVFDDFCAAAEFLQEKGYTDKEHTFIQGGSNGGTLVSACANQRPDLFAGVICQVPVADMLRFHKFTIGHFWCADFGCSEKEGGFDYLIKYSPLHNIKEQKYPAMLVTTADHDDRVVPLHSFKYVAELQHVAGNVPDQRPLLIRIDVNAGHGAGKPTSMIIQEVADVQGFIAKFTNTPWQD